VSRLTPTAGDAERAVDYGDGPSDFFGVEISYSWRDKGRMS
jgi:hypothetical protein